MKELREAAVGRSGGQSFQVERPRRSGARRQICWKNSEGRGKAVAESGSVKVAGPAGAGGQERWGLCISSEVSGEAFEVDSVHGHCKSLPRREQTIESRGEDVETRKSVQVGKDGGLGQGGLSWRGDDVRIWFVLISRVARISLCTGRKGAGERGVKVD